MPSTQQTNIRRTNIIKLLVEEKLTLKELSTKLYPPVSDRVVHQDLVWLQAHFPGRMHAEQDGRAKRWFFRGDAGHVLAHPLSAISDDALTALIVARGLLQIPDPADAPIDAGKNYRGTLACAIDELLITMGFAAEAQALTPDAISISRFGVAPEEDIAFPTAIDALRNGASLHFLYTNLDGRTHDTHVKPIRLAHIAGEWHLFAWATDNKHPPGKIKQYRLSRMTTIKRTTAAPPHCPLTGLRGEAASILRDAFRATGSHTLSARKKVILAISPHAWPFIEKRRWGDKQHCDDCPNDLPNGWRRLSFYTTGLLECRHWVLAFGSAVRAESPPELITWLHEQAQAIITGSDIAIKTTDQKNSEHAATEIGARVQP